MLSFQKIISDHPFLFQENTVSDQVYFNVRVDIYSFKMMPMEKSWKIIGDVPPWIASIENDISNIIDHELM